MVVLNLTKKEAEYLFWVMMSEERDGEGEATSILNKLPLPPKKNLLNIEEIGLKEIKKKQKVKQNEKNHL